MVPNNITPDPASLTEAWSRTWIGLGGTPPRPDLGQHLLDRWAEPHRHYHSTQHLRECLASLEQVAALARRPAEVAIALWFHDAIYDLGAHDNEARSADWARRALHEAGAPEACGQRVHALVMATRHDVSPLDPDQQLLVDIDLGILGAPPARFAQYETQIRAEYSFVPDEAFRQGRRKLLQTFLARPRLYNTERFFASHEAAARSNLMNAIAKLA